MLRAAKPKLSLSVPTVSISTVSAGPKSPFPHPLSPSPIVNSPTARNTALNARGISTVQQPSYSYKNTATAKSILKKDSPRMLPSGGKKIQFLEVPSVQCVSPMPEGYYGEYVKMSRDDRKWAKTS